MRLSGCRSSTSPHICSLIAFSSSTTAISKIHHLNPYRHSLKDSYKRQTAALWPSSAICGGLLFRRPAGRPDKGNLYVKENDVKPLPRCEQFLARGIGFYAAFRLLFLHQPAYMLPEEVICLHGGLCGGSRPYIGRMAKNFKLIFEFFNEYPTARILTGSGLSGDPNFLRITSGLK